METHMNVYDQPFHAVQVSGKVGGQAVGVR